VPPSSPGLYASGTANSIYITRSDTGAAVTLDGLRAKFEYKDEDELLKSNVMDGGGVVVGKRIPGGLSGTIEVERNSDEFNNLMQFLDQNYYAQGADVYFTITETWFSPGTLTNPNINQLQNVVFHGYSRGAWERTAINKPSVSFFASKSLPL
jgi:hypothetical protein